MNTMTVVASMGVVQAVGAAPAAPIATARAASAHAMPARLASPSSQVAFGFRNPSIASARRVASRGGIVVMAASEDGPETSADAIEEGRKLYADKDYAGALVLFESALSLPGTGTKQFTDKPAAPSEGELQTALFNIACCHSRMEDERLGLVALAGCFEKGFDRFDLVNSSDELKFLRSAEKFSGLMGMYRRSTIGGNTDQFGNQYAKVGQEEEEMVDDKRSTVEKFMQGDWMWRALTKTSQVPVKKGEE